MNCDCRNRKLLVNYNNKIIKISLVFASSIWCPHCVCADVEAIIIDCLNRKLLANDSYKLKFPRYLPPLPGVYIVYTCTDMHEIERLFEL